MPDYRVMYDSQFLKAWHLGGKACTLTIVRVEAGVIENHKARKKDKMPFVYFNGQERPLGLNRTNSRTIASIYGNDTTKWVNQRITIYPTTTSFGNDTVDCVRIKPGIPDAKLPSGGLPKDAVPPTPPTDRQPGDDADEKR